MTVDVRWATTADAAALALMLCEMAVHYRQPPLDHDRALSAARKWLGEESPAYPHFALAFVEGEVRAWLRWPSRIPASISSGCCS